MSRFRLTHSQGARSIVALISAAIALTLLPAGGAAAAAASSPSAVRNVVEATTATATEAKVTASLSTDNAGVLSPGQDLTVSVTITNATETAHERGTVSVWVDPTALKSRSALDSWLASTDAVPKAVAVGTAPVGALEPGTSTVVQVVVPAASLPFAANPAEAVYGIGATATVTTSTAADARSSLVWSPGGSAEPSGVGVVFPIVSPPSSKGLLSADDLTTYTAANGVLTRDLDGLERHSTVAIGIDPMIIASIRALGNAAPASATDWLVRLSALPNDTFSLGFGDADLTGQIQSGVTKPLAPTSLAYALNPQNFTPSPTPVGEPPAETPTSPTPSPTPTAGSGPVLPTLDELTSWEYTMQGVAWPGDGTVRAADLAPLVAAGYTTTIVSGANTNAKTLSGTSSAVLPFDGGKLGVADAALSDAIRQAASAPSDSAWNAAMAKVNAQLELTSQEGGTPKNLLLSFDRSWPSSGTQLQRTLDTLLTGPWSTPTTLPQTLSASATDGLALVDAPEAATRTDAIKALVDDEMQIDQFATILDKPETMTGRTRAELLTLLAVSWQSPRSDWTAAVSKSRATTVKTLNAVKIVPTENVNLVSAQGSIPFTVINELPSEAANVVLRASPSNSRLEIDEDVTKRILPDSRATLLVPVKAKLGNGQVTLSLSLFSPTGVPIGTTTSVTVDVHADWEGIGALIVGILLVLLFGFGIVRNVLRRRDRRRAERAEAAAAAAGGGDADGGDADGGDAAGAGGTGVTVPEDTERG
ncbi:DUF6049 family protein [Leifsonia sp. NPDC058230]|uniref:DUF6049 family protein n=1 Tax=Leifsonia sp. NPDC058230 TaxID=3346391 RepID=UPI0036DBDB90